MKHDDELWLNAGVDGELDPERSLQLQARLAADPAFKTAWDAQQALRAAIRERVAYHEAPADLSGRLARAIGSEPVTPPPSARIFLRLARRGWLIGVASAVTASALTAVVVGLNLGRLNVGGEPASRVAEDALAGHTRALLVDRPIEVASSDQHTVRPWLSARLSFSPPVPDLSAHGFELLGARRDVLDGQTVAALVYRRRQHVISAFVRPGGAEREARLATIRGFNVIEAAHAGMACAIVSDLNAKELGDFADLLRAAM